MSLEEGLENLAKILPNSSVLELGSEFPDEVPIFVKTLLVGQVIVSALDCKA